MKRLLLIILLFPIFSREYIAIIDFEAIGVSESEAKALTQRLTSEMIEIGEYQIVERSEMKRLMEEQKFQYSGCANIKCAVDIGKMIGAKYMVVGGVSKVGSTYSIDARMISVESGESYISGSFNHKGEIDYLITEGIKSIAYQLCDMKYKPKNPSLRIFNNEINSNNSGAQLIISSNPIDAMIYINSNYMGNTPIEFSNYPIGNYNITISKENFKSIKEELILVPYGKKNLSYELQCIEDVFCFDSDGDGLGNIDSRQKMCASDALNNNWVKKCINMDGLIAIETIFNVLEMKIFDLQKTLKYRIIYNTGTYKQDDQFALPIGEYILTLSVKKGIFSSRKSFETKVVIKHNLLTKITIDESIFE